MDYKILNENQKNRMKAISNRPYHMKWKEPELMDLLLGKFPKVREYPKDEEFSDEISKLKKVLINYDPFLTDKAAFLAEIGELLSNIHKIKNSWYGLSLYDIKQYVKMHRFCLISGEGGIGKSYFIKCFEEKLEEMNIAHLCIYGKFEKNTRNIDVKEIIKDTDKGFVFVVDAINEMAVEGQKDLLNILRDLKKYPKIRIVISYRTNSMDNTILKEYQNISEYEYNFPGVSFESALSEILKLSVPDVYMYEDIIYSNNALLLGMLCDVLSSEKLINETENGIASITFILEQYIKKTMGKLFKDSLTCKGIDIWRDTKRIAKWMYKNEKKEIDEKSLFSVIKTGENFLSSMMQMGFIDSYENNDEKNYFFAIDSLTDFLIVRSMFEDLKEKTYEEKVDIIKSKVKSMHNLNEPLIVAIFDNMAPDYQKIYNLLKITGLIRNFDLKVLVKVHFKKDDIIKFRKVFEVKRHNTLLQIMGGYTDKPFNCSNYLFDYYCANHENLCNLSNVLSGAYFQRDMENRLKNVLYFTTLNTRQDRRDDEAFYFAILCCAAPNKNVRCLAMKLLYEVVSKDNLYIDNVISNYAKLSDFYIQEAIIHVLSQTEKENSKIIRFFNELIEKEDNLTAKSIRRISTYLGTPYNYITWNKKNLFKYNKDAVVSDYIEDILLTVDIRNKDFFPFRYFGKEHIDIHRFFLINDKKDITKINNYLREKYSCVCGGECSGLMAFEKRVMPEIKSIAKIETMDMNSFMESFERVLRYVFNYFRTSEKGYSHDMCEEDFEQSVYMKCVDIATGIYYGSLMCNYYVNEFATYNNNQNSIGYEVYDPLEDGEEINLTSPIPTYQDFIERLGDYSINMLEVPEIHDINWVKDAELTRRNVLHLLEKIEIKHQGWIMLAGRVSLQEEGNEEWKDTYDLWCCSSNSETICADGNARYLTIELEEYLDELKGYPQNTTKPWLCKSITSIYNRSDIFEETMLVLPPSEIINFLNLKLNISDLSWETEDKEKVIICNNNKSSYYTDPIISTVYIRENYLKKFLEGHEFKYFAFAEKYLPETGYAEETALHFEIVNGKIIKEIKNYADYCPPDNTTNPLCFSCPYFQNEEDTSRDLLSIDAYIKKLLEKYRMKDDSID